jgi:ligand-binding SRPBCC domain-containing protein
MAKVVKDITINAPIEKVYEYISNPEQIPEYQPNATKVTNVTGKGETQQWVMGYKMMGIPFKGKTSVTRSTPNQERRFDTNGFIRSYWFWRIKHENGGTHLNCEMKYTVRVPVLGYIWELLLLQQASHITGSAVKNIKKKMES